MKKDSNKTQLYSRVALLVLMDIAMIQLASYATIFIRFDLKFSMVQDIYVAYLGRYTVINTVITLLIFAGFKLYQSLWKFASTTELLNIIWACIVANIVQYIGYTLMGMRMFLSYYLIYIFLLGAGVIGIRFFYRFTRYLSSERGLKGTKVKNVLIMGAGDAGATIMKEINQSAFVNKKVVCLIDDDVNKHGRYMRGCLIEGGRDKIQYCVEKYCVDEIILAVPQLSKRELRPILNICQETGCKIELLPGLYQLINGEASVSKLRNVEIEDLLGRDAVKIDLEQIMAYVSGKIVMITGGGGSIGSELCRQIAEHQPKQLIIFDIYENNAYDIQQELIRKFPKLDLVVLIGSVRNTHRLESVFEEYHPEIIYHAAAHKHVPLMETSPNEAIKNNVFGTYKLSNVAGKHGVQKFVLISTDKAVNPTNVMGASKRMCEMVVQMMNRQYKTEFVAVRFGNVLGSNGSVIPFFKKQIEEGGPITVTHPDIIRYFMTIPEAVSLVLQAGAYAKGGEIFVLDMGEPVKIVDLAKNLIRLSGYKVGEDISIVYTGLRPGEKLYEELLMDEEGLGTTNNELIHIGKPIEFDEEKFKQQLEELKEVANQDDIEIRKKIKEIVTTYQYEEENKG